MTAPLGSVLAAAREARGLTVDDVAATTRIRASVVRAIECDDFSGCKGDFYARAQLRTIAGVVGADSGVLIEEFDRRVAERVPAEQMRAEAPAQVHRVAARPASRWAVAAALVVVVIVAVLLGVHFTGQGARTAAVSLPSRAHGTQPVRTHRPSAPPSHRPSPTPTPTPTGVHVQVRTDTGRSWLLVTSSSGATLFERTLEAGQASSFSDPAKLVIRFGNAAAVHVSMNGRALGTPCNGGTCTVAITPSTTSFGTAAH